MELRQLRYLVAVADERHFTRAAAREHVAQPALSRQIQALERELGVALVDRTSRRVSLTAAGEQFVAHARRILDEVERARLDIADAGALVTGRLVVGVSAAPGPIDAAELLASFHAEHEAVDLIVREDMTSSLTQLLRDDLLDVAFITGAPDAMPRGLEGRVLATEPLVLVTPPEHRFAGSADPVPTALLADEVFISFPQRATIRRILEEASARAGFQPRTPIESSLVAGIVALVSRGLGVAVLPRSQTLSPAKPIGVAPLADPAFVHTVSVAWRAGRTPSPAARAFLAGL